ncbi:MAG TPA: hypothetical protein PLS53_12575 [Thermoanaerobaculaceae bacterium]|nr:hypothetical protein [Thermoanaerobaculaceae bacterium]
MITYTNDLDNLFTYHPPTPEQAERYHKLRRSAKAFAELIVECTPPGPDQSAAIRKVREAVMTANAAIACGEVG